MQQTNTGFMSPSNINKATMMNAPTGKPTDEMFFKKQFLVLGFVLSLLYTNSSAINIENVTIYVDGTAKGEKGLSAEKLRKVMSKYMSKSQITLEFPKPGTVHNLSKIPRDGSALAFGSTTDLIFANLLKNEEEQSEINQRLIDVLVIEPLVCVTGPQSPYRDFNHFKKTLRENPEKIRHAIFTPINMLFSTYFMRLLGVDYARVSKVKLERGSNVMEEVRANRADYACVSTGYAIKKLLAGEIAPIFSTNLRGIDGFPNIPSVRELGLKNLEKYSYWVALTVPRETPNEVIQYYRNILKLVANDPDWKNGGELQYGVNAIGKIQNPDKFLSEQQDFFEKIVLNSAYLRSIKK